MSCAVITGASSGIGAQFAKELKERLGINDFWFIARRADRMKALMEELGVNAKIISADLGTSEGLNAVKAALEEEKPEVSFLVNAAGFGAFGGFDELSPSSVEGMIDVNVKATVLITHMVVPYMVRGGRIIQLGSGSCFTPLPYFNVYSSSKVFVLHYTKSLNYELKKHGITATCFCPGWVNTDFIDKAIKDKTVTRPRTFKPLLDCERVVKGAVGAAIKGRRMYVVGWFTKMQHLLFKLLPDCILSRLWLGMLEKPKGDNQNEP